MAASNDSVIIQIKYASEQSNGGILRVVGFVAVKNLIKLIDVLDLEANPRQSKVGVITKAIQNSMESTPELFPFKTKGILLGASEYELINSKKNRYKVTFSRRDREGILDGGHNMLAIGLYVLERACTHYGIKHSRVSNWGEFKKEWNDKHFYIDEYEKDARKNEDGTGGLEELDILVPIELLLPVSNEDVDMYRECLLDICDARNNNAQLTDGTRANQRGYFDALKGVFQNSDQSLAERIEWKTNDGGEIKVADIVAMTWIPLKPVVNALGNIEDDQGKQVEPPSPVNFYSGKATGLKRFERLMSSSKITTAPNGDYHRELRCELVRQAFEITADIPELYDYIYAHFPQYYNEGGGSYGSITAVKSMNSTKAVKKTPYGDVSVATASPLGFIAPLVYGLQALVKVEVVDGEQAVRWCVDDPKKWLEENLLDIVKRYMRVIQLVGYDPQKVGKSPNSFDTALDAYTMALAGLK